MSGPAPTSDRTDTALGNAGWLDANAPVPAAAPLLAELRHGPDPGGALRRLAAALSASPALATTTLEVADAGKALIALCGVSPPLSRTAAHDPEVLTGARSQGAAPFDPYGDTSVGDLPRRLSALRRLVRRGLLRIAVRDLLGIADMPRVGAELSDLADAAAAAALAIAHSEAEGPPVPLAVIAMGKWGGGELNYASDIDVLFVFDGEGPEAADYSTRVAEGFMEALGGVTPEGIAFRVDADLRPEGTAGPLARSLSAYRTYYERWAETWELQALIKARPAAGDADLGRAFIDMIEPFVYPDRLSPDAIREIRTMKARVEKQRLPPSEDPNFHVKLGPGGMADIEFTAQLLQLQHGAGAPAVRTPSTISSLSTLAEVGALEPSQARILAEAYRFLGRVRNRLFLQAGRGADSLPTDPDEAARLALSLGYELAPRSTLREEFRAHTRRARRVVMDRFYGATS